MEFVDGLIVYLWSGVLLVVHVRHNRADAGFQQPPTLRPKESAKRNLAKWILSQEHQIWGKCLLTMSSRLQHRTNDEKIQDLR